MMVEDRYFYDPATRRYTVDRYLDEVDQRYGGIDNRNRCDRHRDMPGGIPALRLMVEDFHKRHVRVFFPAMPWDNGTHDPGMSFAKATAQLMAEIGADGVNGDSRALIGRPDRQTGAGFGGVGACASNRLGTAFDGGTHEDKPPCGATPEAIANVVAYNMGEWREIGTILHLSKADIAVWTTTFALMVLSDLTVAVGVGMTLAGLLYIHRVAQTTTVAPVTREYLADGLAHVLQDKEIPANVTILRIHGPFLFGTTEKLSEATKDLTQLADVVILRLRNMTALDATGPENVLPHVQAALARVPELQGDFGGVGRDVAAEMRKRPI